MSRNEFKIIVFKTVSTEKPKRVMRIYLNSEKKCVICYNLYSILHIKVS